MKTIDLLVAKAATGEGTAFAIDAKRTSYGSIPIQVLGTFNATVILEGTISGQAEVDAATASWSPISGASWTDESCDALFCAFTHIRANVTVYLNGSVSVRALN